MSEVSGTFVVPPLGVELEVPPVNHSCFWRFAIATFDPHSAISLSSLACGVFAVFGILGICGYIIQ